jgi:hypothetical protein
VLGHSSCDQHDEGPGRAADLKPRSAEERDEETADDGRVEPLCRGRAGGDRNSH